MIEKSQLVDMFEGMRTQTPWDVDSNLLWGYFFTSKDHAALERLSKDLVTLNYQFVELRPGDLVFTGSPHGVGQGQTPPLFLKPGDQIVTTIERLGQIENVAV